MEHVGIYAAKKLNEVHKLLKKTSKNFSGLVS